MTCPGVVSEELRPLAFARAEMVRPVRLDINGVIVEMLKVLAPILSQSVPIGSVPIGLELSKVLPGAWADEGQLEQIILNLCLNASEAIGGDGTIRTSAVTVSDGPGVYHSD